MEAVTCQASSLAVPVTVIRVVRPHDTDKERDPRESWFVWLGDPEADIAQIAMGYVLRGCRKSTATVSTNSR